MPSVIWPSPDLEDQYSPSLQCVLEMAQLPALLEVLEVQGICFGRYSVGIFPGFRFST